MNIATRTAHGYRSGEIRNPAKAAGNTAAVTCIARLREMFADELCAEAVFSSASAS